jgi:hypothetical protein
MDSTEQLTTQQLKLKHSKLCKKYYADNASQVKRVANEYYRNNRKMVLEKARQKRLENPELSKKWDEQARMHYSKNIEHHKRNVWQVASIKNALTRYFTTNEHLLPTVHQVDDLIALLFGFNYFNARRFNIALKHINPITNLCWPHPTSEFNKDHPDIRLILKQLINDTYWS